MLVTDVTINYHLRKDGMPPLKRMFPTLRSLDLSCLDAGESANVQHRTMHQTRCRPDYQILPMVEQPQHRR